MGKKETVVRADTNLTFLTVSLNNSKYQMIGYQMKASLKLKTMTKNNYPCIEVYFSNKHGKVSIPFHMKANVNNSENGEQFVSRKEKKNGYLRFTNIY